jgi:hypothetical protein
MHFVAWTQPHRSAIFISNMASPGNTVYGGFAPDQEEFMHVYVFSQWARRVGNREGRHWQVIIDYLQANFIDYHYMQLASRNI